VVIPNFLSGLVENAFASFYYSSYICDELINDNMKRSLSVVEYSANEEALAGIAKALGHPVRIRILRLLAGESCCFTGELTELIPMAQSTISQHLKALLESGLIQGEINPPKVRYCINRDEWRKAQLLFRDFFGEESGVGRGECCV
jgi:ArsR family transcriptional regulator, arsenate/arsenite/antimonite-responsive transcriptional repressor